MSRIGQEVSDILHRSMDSHVRIAVTGLSRAGKTAFITSLVNQLLHTSTHDNLPLLECARDNRLIGAKRVPQSNLMVPRFAYDDALEQLHSTPPDWPKPTRDVSEIRLALKYKPAKGAKRLLSKTSTLYIDVIDYPGEWLLDLPLLDMTFEQWSEGQFDNLKGIRQECAETWLSSLDAFDVNAEANEKQIAAISQDFTDYLLECKKRGLHWVQPGRFVLPGELQGAPVLQFFPCRTPAEKLTKNSGYDMLKRRYEEYQSKVVKQFYKNYFSTFDRQIVLVDCLQPLMTGNESFHDMKDALQQIMKSFRYGQSNLLRRLFSSRIDKILFAATKADHVTPEQHNNLVSLLQQLVHPAWQDTAFENIEMSCMSVASIRATQAGFVGKSAENMPALRGTTLAGEPITLYPGDVPAKLPKPEYWQDNRFEFTAFRPLENEPDAPCSHIRIDKALQYLIGDKLR
ncbi:nucleoside triphosphate hydrolase [Vibrio sp. 10N.286.49.C2]|uniref:YcjX family protein n=1 Tax=unclassified Vibrio TaxID=2614977 RepID=UPI000C8404DE|nr:MULTISPECIES: YcjX family protein [unclassified Vibrio]PMH40722.1 nucleoside triphosphate hydrolase [Vibrio sp. 10N.286.49.C2]PMH45253.1 nucleoside triphosphate hydrolase [Vibrio sp. 10N.286.49.B1]PMH78259.1 nucleoside triphosphate hydrolase [Vibrio sp. 10N.286.48.B7]